jgi:hypothetical protein
MIIKIIALTDKGSHANDLQSKNYHNQPWHQKKMFSVAGYTFSRFLDPDRVEVGMSRPETFGLAEQIKQQVRKAYTEYGAEEGKDYRIETG